MTIKLHRCSKTWLHLGWEPCWKVEKALIDMGIPYERVTGPQRRSKRPLIREKTGQSAYPAIELEDGTWYREESADMERRIREGRLLGDPG
jgi:glutathione S-transferase